MLTNIAEKLGILDVVAPWIGNDEGHPNNAGAAQRTTNPTNSDCNARTQRNASKRGLDKTHSTSSVRSENVTTTNPSRRKNAKTLGNAESEQRQREKRRITMLTAQKEEEDRSRKIGQFAKKQRVSYHHRGTNKQYDAFIVGVHLDDGPDKPYYVSMSVWTFFVHH
jgi:hypothetical protein